jgi:Type II secretion system (T2SS), protein F
MERTQPLSLQQQLSLCQQIAQLTKAKLPLEAHLTTGSQQPTATVAGAVQQQLASGKSLADVLAGQSTPHSISLAACIRVGEATGKLDRALESWTELHIANAQSSKRLRSSMLYPLLLIIIMFVSICFSFWTLIPGIDQSFQLFRIPVPQWLQAMIWLRANFAVLLLAMALATFGPLSWWWWKRSGNDELGVTRNAAKRLRLQSLSTQLAVLQLEAGRPLAEVLPRCLACMGLPETMSADAFDRFRRQEPLVPLPAEFLLLLGSLYAGLIRPEKLVELLTIVTDQLKYQADLVSQRESNWLPMYVAIIVSLVTLLAYGILVYLPWLELLQSISQPQPAS